MAKKKQHPAGMTNRQLIESGNFEEWGKRMAALTSSDQTNLFPKPSKKSRSQLSKLELAAAKIHSLQAEIKRQQRILFDRPAVSWKHGYLPIPIEIILATDLTDADKVVWCSLFRYSFDKRHAWPSEKTLAHDLARSVRSIQRSLKRLVNRGYLTISVKWQKGFVAMNSYTFNLEELTHRSK